VVSKRSLRSGLRPDTPKTDTPAMRALGRFAPFLFGQEDQRTPQAFEGVWGARSPPSGGVAKHGIDPVILFMATNYLSTRTGTAGKGAGAKHAAYISGLDRYAEKDEVKTVIDKIIPASVAKDGLEFFQKADELERANGRSYRSLIIAIPREAADKAAWAQTLVDDLLKDKHAYRLAIHDKGDGNPPRAFDVLRTGFESGQNAQGLF